jgi:hypothetical protein
MAAELGNVSGGTGWSSEAIVGVVALLIGIPAAVVAVFMLGTYCKRRRQGREGETFFLRPHGHKGRMEHLLQHTEYHPSPSCDSCCAVEAGSSDDTTMSTTSEVVVVVVVEVWVDKANNYPQTVLVEKQLMVEIRICSKVKIACGVCYLS